MRHLLGTKPVGTLVLNAANSAIATNAWTQVTASVPNGASAVEIFNSTGATLKLSQGAIASEAAHILPYTILQGGSSILVPMEVKAGSPITVESLDNAASTGILVLNLFG